MDIPHTRFEIPAAWKQNRRGVAVVVRRDHLSDQSVGTTIQHLDAVADTDAARAVRWISRM